MGCRQAGGKDRVETVWSHAATTGSTGRNAQPGGCSGCCVPLSGYCTTHCICCTVLTPYSIHLTVRPTRFYLLFTHCTGQPCSSDCGKLWLVCRGQHFSPSGLAGSINDKDKGRELQSRDARFGTVPRTVPCTVVLSVPRKCLLTLRLQCVAYEPTWKVCAIHNTHTRTPSTHPLTHTLVCHDRFIAAIQ